MREEDERLLDSDDRLARGRAIMAALDELAVISETPEKLTRLSLTPEHGRANDKVAAWMREAGMSTHVDAIGNVIGRYEGDRPGLPALLIGSHLDTVRDAGRYDGMLGVVTAIACVGRLHRQQKRLPFAIEIVGFCDEEGVRFGAALFGSRAIAGTFDYSVLQRRDADGVTVADAVRSFGLDPAAIGHAARQRGDFLGYVELHIEQGPVLERANAAVGCVTSINGVTRALVRLTGDAGHAGTVPMQGRRDALAAAAEIVLAVERRCAEEAGLRGTVGRLSVAPGAVNVIPGSVELTIDVRAPDDGQRERAFADIEAAIGAICTQRAIGVDMARTFEAGATPCAAWIMRQIESAITAEGVAPLHLPSGAGHDGMAIAALTDIGMIFVRCAGGISHSPLESISMEDACVAAEVLYRFIKNFEPEERK